MHMFWKTNTMAKSLMSVTLLTLLRVIHFYLPISQIFFFGGEGGVVKFHVNQTMKSWVECLLFGHLKLRQIPAFQPIPLIGTKATLNRFALIAIKNEVIIQ